ncbi:unnamed protein product [Peniophora sp. CBMAI 1063]|nr:unnamed protein product [Peniophora sp. CBMAI 1063]
MTSHIPVASAQYSQSIDPRTPNIIDAETPPVPSEPERDSPASLPTDPGSAMDRPAQSRPVGPLLGYIRWTRLRSETLLASSDLRARADFSRQLGNGAAIFRALWLEMSARANALAPIFRLPREVLVMIAAVLTVDWPIRPPERRQPPIERYTEGSLGWALLSHVCRSWRDTLLDAHDLWARHVGILPNAMMAFLKRSGSHTPLDFKSTLGPGLRVPSCEELVSRLPLHRVRSMRWHFFVMSDAEYFHRDFLVNTTASLEALERLHVHTNKPIGTWPEPAQTDPQLLPSIRALTLSGFHVSFVMPQLEKLGLASMTIGSQQFLDVLSSSPRITYIELVDCYFLPLDMTQVTKIKLTRLQLLCVARCDYLGNGPIIGWLAKHLDFPAHAKFKLFPHEFFSETSEAFRETLLAPDLYSAIELCSRTIMSREVEQRPNILSFDETATEMHLLTHDKPPSTEDVVWKHVDLRGALYQARIDYWGYGSRRGMTSVFKDIASPRKLHFEFITVLHISRARNVPWEAVYPALPNVHTLRLAARNIDPIEVLGRQRIGEVEGFASRIPIYLPRLQLLWIDDTPAGEYDEDKHRYSTNMRSPLVNTLKARRDICARCDTPASPRILYLQNFVELPDWDAFIGELRDVVPTVEHFDTELAEYEREESVETLNWSCDSEEE